MRYTQRIFQSAPVLVLSSYLLINFANLAPYFVGQFIGIIDKHNLTFITSYVAYSWIIFFIIPALIAKLIFKRSMADLGLTLPEKKFETSLLTLLALSLLMPFIWNFAHRTEFQLGYEMRNVKFIDFLYLQLILTPLYYFAEEFFYRGFLLYSLWRKVRWHAFWITGIFFAFAHLGKPMLEIYLAIPVSVILNLLTLRAGSIYPSMLIHFVMGATLNTLIYLQN